MKSSICLFVIVLAFQITCQAQIPRIELFAGYSYILPEKTLKEYSRGDNLNGVAVGADFIISNHFSLGISTGWNVYSKVTKTNTDHPGTVEVRSVYTEFVRVIPLFVNFNYYLINNSSMFRPYVGIGLGNYSVKYKRWVGAVSMPYNNAFLVSGFRPEAGASLFVYKDKLSLKAKVSYNYSFDYKREYSLIKNLRYWNGEIGLCYSI